MILAVIAAGLLPKCLVCLAGYIALASGFAAAAPELCGTAAGEAAWSPWWFAFAAAALFAGAFRLMAGRAHAGLRK